MKRDRTQVTTEEQLRSVLNDISFRNSVLDFKWQYEYKWCSDPDKPGWFIWVTFERPDTYSNMMGRGRGRDEFINVGTTVSGVVKTCWVLVQMNVMHELMEGFNWRHARIFNPHNSVQSLANVQAEEDE